MHQTVRDRWKIRDITCEYVYLDENRKKRDPEEGNFRPGEFEKLYR
ncbi:MAG: hypothetical protein GY795_25560 [Desulfobacterales bacterium]|nr:hypothetical protein [Desulfobacterales bacterium]